MTRRLRAVTEADAKAFVRRLTATSSTIPPFIPSALAVLLSSKPSTANIRSYSDATGGYGSIR
jgi:hypothetical protein